MGENTCKWYDWQGVNIKIYEQLIQINNKKQSTWLKNEQKIWIGIFQKKTYRWPTGTWRWPASLITGEMQIKITLRYHLTSVRKAIIKKSTNKKCWWGCRKKRDGGRNANWYSHCGLWKFIRKRKTESPHDLVIPSLGIYRKETSTLIQMIHAPQCSKQCYLQ